MNNRNTLVITPTLGDRESLSRTVESVEMIGKDRVDHILTCPQSKVEDLKKRFPSLKIIPEPENFKGIYGALNNVINKYFKDYKYFTYINDDDYWLQGFQNLISLLDKNSNIDAVYGRVNYYNEQGFCIGSQTSSKRYKSFKILLKSKIILFTQQTTLIRTSIFEYGYRFDDSYKLVADTKFWINLIDSGFKFHYLNQIVAAYTLQNNQLSSDKVIQNSEHVRLLNEFKGKNFSKIEVYYEKILFRLTNLKIYLFRLLSSLRLTNNSNQILK